MTDIAHIMELADELADAAAVYADAATTYSMKPYGSYIDVRDSQIARDAARAALESALRAALGEQEPVAWMCPTTRDVINAERKAAWMTEFGEGARVKAEAYSSPLYAAPLKPLTDERIVELFKAIDHRVAYWGQREYAIAFARAVEAAIKEQG